MTSTDPRALALAKARQQIAHREYGSTADWSNFSGTEQRLLVEDAAAFLQAAIEAGIAPAAERPTDKHDAVWLDDDGWLWGEYQTSPSSHGDAILRLVWESEQCSSKRELEEQGVQFRLIGWSS